MAPWPNSSGWRDTFFSSVYERNDAIVGGEDLAEAEEPDGHRQEVHPSPSSMSAKARRARHLDHV
jgi:hypothetical protein